MFTWMRSPTRTAFDTRTYDYRWLLIRPSGETESMSYRLVSCMKCSRPCLLLAVVFLSSQALRVLGQEAAKPSAAEAVKSPQAFKEEDTAIAQALEAAGENRAQIAAALERVPADQRQGMRFLVANMPPRDLTSLSADFLLENCELAYREWRAAPWHADIPVDIFLNNILPYANINEGRDPWRKEFIERFKPLVRDAKSPAQAAAILNQKIFGLVNVKYSTQRPKADQSPAESIKAGLASCSGLTVLLIDACRAVGVPARFVGTPLWSDNSGNHSWAEVWDQGWHFTGAAEPSGDQLDQAWFVARASTAQRDHRLHAIYAVSFQKTPISFPLVWDRSIRYVHAVNVTDRYAGKAQPLAEGHCRAMFRVTAEPDLRRCCAKLVVRDADDQIVWEGESNDERFDANDHISVPLKENTKYRVAAQFDGRSRTVEFQVSAKEPLVQIALPGTVNAGAAIQSLKDFLAGDRPQRGKLEEQAFARTPLTRDEAEQAKKLLFDDHATMIRTARAEEMKNRSLKIGEMEMRFDYRLFGDAPKEGRALYISMHGGGGAPKQVNDQQWENQKRLYQVPEGVYLAPRAPTDTWDLWHQGHIDRFFDRLIENLIVFENVNPNKVYLMGYSAGGDGVYQVAPRTADRWAAASMMAGHPNEASPLGLRNLPFSIHVGGNDGAYNRNKIAADWGERLQKLREADPKGYENWVKIYPDKGHWLDREDAAAIPWMTKFQRNTTPARVVWYQDDVTEPRFYWLAVPEDQRKAGTQITATRDGQNVVVDAQGVNKIRIRWNDQLANLDQPVVVTAAGKERFQGKLERNIATIAKTLEERGDPESVFSAETEVALD